MQPITLPTPLVSVDWLAAHLDHPDLVILDAHMAPPGSAAPSEAAQQIPGVIQRLLEVYVGLRHEGEIFIDAVERLGLEPFKARVYGEVAA